MALHQTEITSIQHLDRKTKKPLMEKRRRARINKCLIELKSLLLEALKRDPSQTSKLEKADILEMTVHLLRSLQRQQLALAVGIDATVFDKYQAGWTECALQVAHYVNSVQGFNAPVKSRLLKHLDNCYRSIAISRDQMARGSEGAFPPGFCLPNGLNVHHSNPQIAMRQPVAIHSAVANDAMFSRSGILMGRNQLPAAMMTGAATGMQRRLAGNFNLSTTPYALNEIQTHCSTAALAAAYSSNINGEDETRKHAAISPVTSVASSSSEVTGRRSLSPTESFCGGISEPHTPSYDACNGSSVWRPW